MNCSPISPNNYRVVDIDTKSVFLQNRSTLVFQDLGPDNCFFSSNASNSQYVDIEEQTDYWALTLTTTQIQDGCPTWIYAFGRMGNRTIDTAQASVVQCRPSIEQVNLDATFRIWSFQLDPTTIPSAISDTRKTLYDGSFWKPTFSNESSESDILPTDMDQFLSSAQLQDNSSISWSQQSKGLFMSMIEGINGTTPEALTTSTEKLIQGIQRVYGITLAQLISAYARQSYPTNTEAAIDARPTFKAVLSNAKLVRMKQNEVSTRIVEALLVCMAICVITTMILITGISRVLYKSPYTIAATWGLLAGSKMLEEDSIPLGAEFCNDTQLKERGVFEARTFTLGWRRKEGSENDENARGSFMIDFDND